MGDLPSEIPAPLNLFLFNRGHPISPGHATHDQAKNICLLWA